MEFTFLIEWDLVIQWISMVITIADSHDKTLRKIKHSMWWWNVTANTILLPSYQFTVILHEYCASFDYMHVFRIVSNKPSVFYQRIVMRLSVLLQVSLTCSTVPRPLSLHTQGPLDTTKAPTGLLELWFWTYTNIFRGCIDAACMMVYECMWFLIDGICTNLQSWHVLYQPLYRNDPNDPTWHFLTSIARG